MHPYAARVERPIRVGKIRSHGRFNADGDLDRPEEAQPREDATDVDGSDDKRIRLMSKQRKKLSENSIFANNPFLEDLLEWRDSPEGKQSMAVSDALWILLEGVQLDAKQRKFIWPDAERLDLEHSVQRIQKQYPDFARDRIEEFLINWIEGGYAPENYDQAQLDELDRLAGQWVADHMRPSNYKATKKGKRTPYS
jgi:hypothetical protein